MPPHFYRHDKHLVATHIPLLARVFDVSQGDVLEIGTGFFSTLLLRWLSSASGRELYSYESRGYWYDRAKSYEKEHHHTVLCSNWDSAPFEQNHWGMIFVDHSPNARRVVEIARLKDCADYIVIHDSEPGRDNIYHYSTIWNLFKYKYDYTKIFPWTSVVSNKIDLTNFHM